MNLLLEFSTAVNAALLSILSMLSLIIGVAVGIYLKPSHRTNAIIMAFGTGALIQALVLDLAHNGALQLIEKSQLSNLLSWAIIASGFIAGGFLYYIVNVILEKRGAAIRHPALSKLYLLKKKREESAIVIDRLSKVELVRSLPPEDMEDLLLCIQPVTCKTGETIFVQGEKGNAFYLIDQGIVSIIAEDQELKDAKQIAQLKTGDSFGEMALLTGEPRTASAIALTETTLLKIEKEHFHELLDRSPRLRFAVNKLTSSRLESNVERSQGMFDAKRWQKVALANIQRLTRAEENSLRNKHESGGAPIAIFLGAMMDGIPESLVIGSSFVSFETVKFSFIAAVFLANLPEAIASAIGMKDAGYSNFKVFGLWSALVFAGAIAAALGNMYLASSSPIIIVSVGAVAGGGILAMVSSVMMPEAYEDGGPAVGLATIAGFLTAFLFSFL